MYCIVLLYIYTHTHTHTPPTHRYILTNHGHGSDVKFSKLFQTKPIQTVFFLFPNLSKNSQPESTRAVYRKFL